MSQSNQFAFTADESYRQAIYRQAIYRKLAAFEKREIEFMARVRYERAKRLGLVLPDPETRYHLRPKVSRLASLNATPRSGLLSRPRIPPPRGRQSTAR
jgi:hypothetical protein